MSLINHPAIIPTTKNRTIKQAEKNKIVDDSILIPCVSYVKFPQVNSNFKKNCLFWRVKDLLILRPCVLGSLLTLLSISSTPLFIGFFSSLLIFSLMILNLSQQIILLFPQDHQFLFRLQLYTEIQKQKDISF